MSFTDFRRENPERCAELIAACNGDVANAREIFEEMVEDSRREAMLAERERCLTLVQYARMFGASDEWVAKRALEDINGDMPAVPRELLGPPIPERRTRPLGLAGLLPKQAQHEPQPN